MQFDYEAVRLRMINSLRSKVSWAEILDFSSNAKIIEVFAKEVSELGNFDIYLTRENQWSLAKNISSLLSSSDILSYRVHRKVGSVGELTLSPSSSFTGTHPNTIMIPKYTIFSSSEDAATKFCTTVNTSIPASTASVEVDVVQGTPKSYTYTALGNNYEEVPIYSQSIEDLNYEVYVNGVLWTEVDNLLEAAATATSYEIKNLYNFAGVQLRFGNDIFGKKLASGDTVVFYYIDTLGALGNISRANIVTTVESTIYDTVPAPVTIYCKNLGTMDGGDGIESKDSIRLNAPKIFQSGNRAVTKDDYATILENSNLVYKVNVWGEYEYLIDNNLTPGDPTSFVPLQENKVNIAGLKNTGEPLDETDKANIIAYLDSYKSPTDIIAFYDPEVVYLHFICTAYVRERSYSLTTVKMNILLTLADTYSFQNFNFGTNIYETDYKTLVDGVDGVDHNYTLLKAYNLIPFDQANSASFTLSLYPVTPSIGSNISIKVYLKGPTTDYFQIGQDDGSGNIDGLTVGGVPYDLTGSVINYTTGIGFIQITSPVVNYLTYTLKVEYAIDDTDFVLKTRSQIFRYGEAEVSTLYMQ